ncbi:phosphatidylinositol-glycan biosynthesis class S protein [Scheffersomyces amazonensis]|uniref:phosphatidylinositol-glycan biosynthesis class S protein n=1 Tax=Scheffersomyces amazonensis TaxID=1078765 RepID=UPI00315D96CD
MAQESHSVRNVRRWIVVVIAALVLGLGYPLFWGTTTIYRADLPYEEIQQLTTNLQHNIQFRIPVYLQVSDPVPVSSTQQAFNTRLSYTYPELGQLWSVEFTTDSNTVDSHKDYVVIVKKANVLEDSFQISPYSKMIEIFVSDKTVADEYIASVLVDQVFKEEIQQLLSLTTNKNHDTISTVMPYSSDYNIVFSLFVENGVEIDWQIEQSIELFTPILDRLSHFANFSIATQVQYYSKLSKEIKYNEEDQAFVLKPSDLTTFINFGDWNLFTHDINPTINFIIFFPASNYDNKPWKIEGSKKNSFLVPQWGGVHIFNKELPLIESSKVTLTEDELIPVLEVFSSQLFQLLGFVNSPKSPSIRIDTLSRVSTYKNLKQSLESLTSLIKVTNSLSEISIPELTKEYVNKSLDYAKKAIEKVNNDQDYLTSVTYSSLSLKNSDRAFFEKEMVQQAYFPSEHKLAVFLPLLGPIGSIISIGILKLISDIKKDRSKAKKEKSE